MIFKPFDAKSLKWTCRMRSRDRVVQRNLFFQKQRPVGELLRGERPCAIGGIHTNELSLVIVWEIERIIGFRHRHDGGARPQDSVRLSRAPTHPFLIVVWGRDGWVGTTNRHE